MTPRCSGLPSASGFCSPRCRAASSYCSSVRRYARRSAAPRAGCSTARMPTEVDAAPMAATRRVLIGLPAYNEEIALPRLLARIAPLAKSSAEPIAVVLYNVGSTDATVRIAGEWQSRLPLVILDGVVNKGLGAGLRALVEYAVAQADDDDVLVVMDCDDTHDPAQIADMLRRLGEGADVVIGS